MALAPTTSHGGSSSPPDSWLASYLAAQAVDPAGAAVAFNSPPDGHAGTDLSISPDGKTVTCNTTGLYVVTVYLVVLGTAPAQLTMDPVFTPFRGFFNTVDTEAVIDANGGFKKEQWTYAPVTMQATDTLQVFFNANGTTITALTSSNLVVVRVA